MTDNFRVGLAAEPTSSDPRCVTEADAIEQAARMAKAHGFYSAVCVWDERDDPVWLFMLGEQFRKA